jgi:uncharacterized lipoprotein YddW (UPF0748 family)
MVRFGLGVWSRNISAFGSPAEVRDHARALAETGFDIVLPQVKCGTGSVSFLTDYARVDPSYPEWDPLMVLIEACAPLGIKVHPWLCAFREGPASRLLADDPSARAVYRGESGDGQSWSCACRPESQNYVFRLCAELIRRYRPAGLHLDCVRTNGVCRCECCAGEMTARGVEIDEADRPGPAFDTLTNWRVARVTGFVERIRDLAADTATELSASVFADYPNSIWSEGQDWVEWADRKLVDYVFPMTYSNSVRAAAAYGSAVKRLVGDKVFVRPGLGKSTSASQLTPDELGAQLGAVLEAGADGAVVFDWGALGPEDVAALKDALS